MKAKTFFIVLGITALLCLAVLLIYIKGVINFVPYDSNVSQNDSSVQDNNSISFIGTGGGYSNLLDMENRINQLQNQINALNSSLSNYTNTTIIKEKTTIIYQEKPIEAVNQSVSIKPECVNKPFNNCPPSDLTRASQ
jgi:ABC-type phosphate transport system ATPase subunit